MISFLRYYSPALVIAAWLGVWLAGCRNDVLAGAFLALAGVCLLVSERERKWLVRRKRGSYRRRSTDP